MESGTNKYDKTSGKLAYIVMPPGHGKSFLHAEIYGLVEADSIYDCRGDEALADARSIARHTGVWARYDKKWSERLTVRLTGHRWVIMVPSKTIGEIMGGTHLGTLQLADDQWNKNLKTRGKTCSDYGYARCTDPDTRFFEDNVSLTNWVLLTSSQWLFLAGGV
jgi:hypothetical protein